MQKKRYDFHLEFGNITVRNGFRQFACTPPLRPGHTAETYALARLLNESHPDEIEDLQDELRSAMSGDSYEEYFSTDNSSMSIRITPSLVILDDCNIPIADIIELIEDWLSFCKAS